MEKTNKITINGITVPDGTDVKTAVENGNLVITFSKESEVEEPKFKSGDFIYVEYKYNDKHVALFGRDDYETISMYGWLKLGPNIVWDCKCDMGLLIKKNIISIRYATEEEIAKFNKEFAEQKQLRWDEKELKFKEYRWRAKKGGKYWYISSRGKVEQDSDDNDFRDIDMFQLHNYFQTEYLANKALPKWKEFFKSLSL